MKYVRVRATVSQERKNTELKLKNVIEPMIKKQRKSELRVPCTCNLY